MEEQEIIDHDVARVKVVWLIKGIAKSKITLQPAHLSEANMPTRFIRWLEGEPRPVRVPWVVAKTHPTAVTPVQKLEPTVIDMRKHVQWRETSPRVQVSWMTRNTPAPVHEDATIMLFMPKSVKWECGSKVAPKVSWVK